MDMTREHINALNDMNRAQLGAYSSERLQQTLADVNKYIEQQQQEYDAAKQRKARMTEKNAISSNIRVAKSVATKLQEHALNSDTHFTHSPGAIEQATQREQKEAQDAEKARSAEEIHKQLTGTTDEELDEKAVTEAEQRNAELEEHYATIKSLTEQAMAQGESPVWIQGTLERALSKLEPNQQDLQQLGAKRNRWQNDLKAMGADTITENDGIDIIKQFMSLPASPTLSEPGAPGALAPPGTQRSEYGTPFDPESPPTQRTEDMYENWEETERHAQERGADVRENDPYAHERDNLASGDQQRNVNRMNARDTLRYSRLADAINNRYHRMPHRLDDRTATYGGGETGQAGEFGQQYKMPIETEETRQQGRSRGYEATVRATEIARQAASRGMNIEQVRAQLEGYLRETLGMNEQEIKKNMAMFDYEMGYYTKRQANAFENARYFYTRNLDEMRIPPAQAKYLNDHLLLHPAFSGMLAQMWGANVTPSQEQWLLMYNAARHIANVPDDQKQKAFTKFMVENIGETVKGGAAGAVETTRAVYDEFTDFFTKPKNTVNVQGGR